MKQACPKTHIHQEVRSAKMVNYDPVQVPGQHFAPSENQAMEEGEVEFRSPVLAADLPVPGGPQSGLSDGSDHQDPQDRLGSGQSSAEEFVGGQ